MGIIASNLNGHGMGGVAPFAGRQMDLYGKPFGAQEQIFRCNSREAPP
jgi:hypothetical protein